MKLSSRGTGITRQMKRYFVLRNRTLQCFRAEPQRGISYSLGGVVNKNADSELSASLLLTADTSVHVEYGGGISKSKDDKKSKIENSNNSTSLLTIKTPGKTFNIRLRAGKHSQTEATFISQLRKSIEMAKLGKTYIQ